MKSKQTGFTLIELLIVVSIVAILAAVAIPSYLNSIERSRRTDGTAALLSAVSRQERLYFQNNQYTGTIADVGGNTSSEGFYSISVLNDAATCAVIGGGGLGTCYQLTATAVGAQLNDTACRTFVVDSLGRQTAQDSLGVDNTATCWR